MPPQKARLYVYTSAFATQLRAGDENFASRSSFSDSAASAGSPVVLETTRLEVTLPFASTPLRSLRCRATSPRRTRASEAGEKRSRNRLGSRGAGARRRLR